MIDPVLAYQTLQILKTFRSNEEYSLVMLNTYDNYSGIICNYFRNKKLGNITVQCLFDDGTCLVVNTDGHTKKTKIIKLKDIRENI